MEFIPAPKPKKQVTTGELSKEKEKRTQIPGWKVQEMLAAIPASRVKLKCIHEIDLHIQHVGTATKGVTVELDKEEAHRLLVGGCFKLIGAASGKSKRQQLEDWDKEFTSQLRGDRKPLSGLEVDQMLKEIKSPNIRARVVKDFAFPNYGTLAKGKTYDLPKINARPYLIAGYLILLGEGTMPPPTENEKIQETIKALETELERVKKRIQKK